MNTCYTLSYALRATYAALNLYLSIGGKNGKDKLGAMTRERGFGGLGQSQPKCLCNDRGP